MLIKRGTHFLVADKALISRFEILIRTEDSWPVGALVDLEVTLTGEAHPYLGEARVVEDEEGGAPRGDGPWLRLTLTRLTHKGLTVGEKIQEWDRARRIATQSAVDIAQYLRLMPRGDFIPGKDFGQPGAGHRRPVLVIHGFFGTRGAMFLLEQRLKAIGFPVFSVSLGLFNVDDIKISAERIAEKVDQMTAEYHLDRINILGHSMGGLIGLHYIKKLGGAPRVRRLVSIGTPFRGAAIAKTSLYTMPWSGWLMKSLKQITPGSGYLKELHDGTLPDGVEYVSIMAKNDQVVDPRACVLEGARNIMIPTNHAGLVVSPKRSPRSSWLYADGSVL
ncbi:MAG: alpha/beta fold hydrolase [Deltaproteobacteria bacterium]|nr:alpha/beta fold hydrolase [Deltaproteobacteria bacterium]